MRESAKTVGSSAGVVRLAVPKRGDPALAELADAYMAQYAGRDRSRLHYLQRWREAIGDLRLSELDPDVVADALEEFAAQPKRKFKGRATTPATTLRPSSLRPQSANSCHHQRVSSRRCCIRPPR